MRNKTTVNREEVKKFSLLAEEWWDETGKFKTLHDINPIRIKYIKDNILKHFQITRAKNPLLNLKILDIGCGGGLLSAPINRLGASVMGIDPAQENIKIAKQYTIDNGLSIDFQCCTTKELIKNYSEQFDVVLNMEIVEHVNNVEDFLVESAELIKNNGMIFIATINKTIKSLIQAKFAAEYLLRWIPIGTHQWKKFIKPEKIISIMRSEQLEILDIVGMRFKLFQKKWVLSDTLAVNYIICFKKL